MSSSNNHKDNNMQAVCLLIELRVHYSDGNKVQNTFPGLKIKKTQMNKCTDGFKFLFKMKGMGTYFTHEFYTLY